MSEDKWNEYVDRYIYLREENNGDFGKVQSALNIERILCTFGMSMIEQAVKGKEVA